MKNNQFSNLNKKAIVYISTIIGLLLVLNVGKLAYSEESSPVNDVILEGLNECSQLQNDSCLGVMHALNNICAVEYFPACFGDSWEPMMNELKKIYEHENKDTFVTVNNEHFNK